MIDPKTYLKPLIQINFNVEEKRYPKQARKSPKRASSWVFHPWYKAFVLNRKIIRGNNRAARQSVRARPLIGPRAGRLSSESHLPRSFLQSRRQTPQQRKKQKKKKVEDPGDKNTDLQNVSPCQARFPHFSIKAPGVVLYSSSAPPPFIYREFHSAESWHSDSAPTSFFFIQSLPDKVAGSMRRCVMLR